MITDKDVAWNFIFDKVSEAYYAGTDRVDISVGGLADELLYDLYEREDED